MNTFTRFAAVVTLATSLATPALAAPATYVIDPTHTFARFSYDHFGLSTQLSRFDKTSGTIVLDKEARTAAVDVVIDTTSVDTGYATFNEHIQAPDFLDTAQFPTATFKSTKVDFAGDQPTAIHGNLTIKGVTRPVTLLEAISRHKCTLTWQPNFAYEFLAARVRGSERKWPSSWLVIIATPGLRIPRVVMH